MRGKAGKILLCSLLVSLLLTAAVTAVNPQDTLNSRVKIEGPNINFDLILDGDGITRIDFESDCSFTLNCPEEIGGIYVEFAAIPAVWTLDTNAGPVSCGAHGYLHEYVPVSGGNAVTLNLKAPTQVCDVFVLPAGKVPDWVQQWEEPWDKADVLVLPTHSDDDQLYFGGLIPWCLDKGARVQVAYLIEHFGYGDRMNELLDGLWTCGLRNYPVLGDYRDLGNISYLETLSMYNNNCIYWEDFEGRQVELFRRFQPQVVVTHALNGEYGHGAHILHEMVSVAAAKLSGDESKYPESAELYGAWDVPKVYVHNYSEGKVKLDFDSPLDYFGGSSAISMSRLAFQEHKSQYNFYSWWLNSKPLSADIVNYNPCEYGLYRSTVGEDTHTDTLFDNIVLYDEQARLALEAEEARKAEEAAQEEARLEAEEQASLEAEEEARRAEETAFLAQEEAYRMERNRLILLFCGAMAAALISAAVLIKNTKKLRKERMNEKE